MHVNETMFRLEYEDDGDGKKFKIESICDNAMYNGKLVGHLLSLYYLVLWKSYPMKENTW